MKDSEKLQEELKKAYTHPIELEYFLAIVKQLERLNDNIEKMIIKKKE